MTFQFKCDCGAILMVIAHKPEDALVIIKANGWKPTSNKPIRAWTDTGTAVCPVCDSKAAVTK